MVRQFARLASHLGAGREPPQACSVRIKGRFLSGWSFIRCSSSSKVCMASSNQMRSPTCT